MQGLGIIVPRIGPRRKRPSPLYAGKRIRKITKPKAREIKFQIRDTRPQDPITKLGTLLEQSIHAPVILRAVASRVPGGEAEPVIQPLYNISPLDVVRYKKDERRQIVYPVLRPRVLMPSKPNPTYFEMGAVETDTFRKALGTADFAKHMGLGGMNDLAELGGFFSIAKKALVKVKNVAFNPVKTFKSWRKKTVGGGLLRKKDIRKAAKGKKFSVADLMKGGKINKLAELASRRGELPPDAQQLMEEQIAAGDYAGAYETGQQFAPATFGPPGPAISELPGWVLPVGAIGAAFLLLKKKK